MANLRNQGGSFTISKNGTDTFAMRNGQIVEVYREKPHYNMKIPLNRPTNPERFRGPRLKLNRAKHHIRELETLDWEFLSKSLYALINEIDPKSGENVYRILVHECIPSESSAVIGDAIHNIRCALDFLVCDLARANGKVPNQNGGFPIQREAKRFKMGSTPKISGVSASSERLINRLRGCEKINTPLFYLNILDV